ncbi:hypothetical protein BJX61DRAFT_543736 [Aspergillus egyptiacus]|nr:hypothetical protein BJX61DRAFT_543736 [Aspergillus egyptiacus]
MTTDNPTYGPLAGEPSTLNHTNSDFSSDFITTTATTTKTARSTSPQSSQTSRRSSQEDSDGEIYERQRLMNSVSHMLRDETTPIDNKIDWVARELKDTSRAASKAEKRMIQLEYYNQDLKAELSELKKSNEDIFAAYQKKEKELQDLLNEIQLKASQKRDDDDYDYAGQSQSDLTQLEMLRKAQEIERELRDELDERNIRLEQLELDISRADSAVREQNERFRSVEKSTYQWADNIKDHTMRLSAENDAMRMQLEQMNRFINLARANDAARWRATLQEAPHAADKHEPLRLTPSLDSETDDSDDGDVSTPSEPERQQSPMSIRPKRQLAQPPTQPKRIGSRREGSSHRQTPHPIQVKRESIKDRAARTYLRERNREGKKLPEPVKTNTGLLPRKRTRTRVEKGNEMARRLKAIEEAVRLPPPPKRIGPWYSPNGYDRRYDREFDTALQKLSGPMKELPESVANEANVPVEEKIIPITDPVDHYVPRSRVFSTPRYLPTGPNPLPVEERRQWMKAASRWTLGPPPRKLQKGEKKVRFAEDVVEYEPDRPADEWPDFDPPVDHKPKGESGSIWKNILILFLFFLLIRSNMDLIGRSEDPKRVWRRANNAQEDITVILRSPDHHSGREAVPPTIVDFELARWSDVDPKIYG